MTILYALGLLTLGAVFAALYRSMHSPTPTHPNVTALPLPGTRDRSAA